MGKQRPTHASVMPKRKLNPDRTRQDILAAAHDEFVEHGLSGARVDAIAARTNTVKRMIYYYFGSKENLYLSVLERAYVDIREAEQALELDHLSPMEALRRLVEFTFDYHDSHPDFVRLVNIENIHHARHIAQSTTIKAVNKSVVETLRRILDRGKQAGVFKPDADPVDLHMLNSALCFFHVSNRHTFGVLFGRNLSDAAQRRSHRLLVTEAVLRSLERRPEGA